jgi:hypothetical protein
MGEARRKRTYPTMDGGPPSNTPTTFDLCVTKPGDPTLVFRALAGDVEAARRLKLLLSLMERLQRRPTMLCGACDTEIGVSGQPPALFYWTEPQFPKGPATPALPGSCARSALLISTRRSIGSPAISASRWSSG